MSWPPDAARFGASAEFADWARTFPSAKSAWLACPKPEWSLWLAAEVPNLSKDEQRTVVRAALETAGDVRSSYLMFLRAWVGPREALEAWSRGDRYRLDSRQKLIAGNLAFVLALSGVIALDHVYGALFGTGTLRAFGQAAAVMIAWAALAPFAWMIRRRQLDGAARTLSFDEAVKAAATLLQNTARDRDAATLAASFRGSLRTFSSTDFG